MHIAREELRKIVIEALGGGINTNNIVDPSAALTDPMNDDFVPQNKTELAVSISSMLQGISDEEAPCVYKHIKQVIDDNLGEEMNDVNVEEVVRKAVRKVLEEKNIKREKEVVDFDDEDDDEDRKMNTAASLGGATFDEIAKSLGYSVAGAKQAVDKALEKAQFVGSIDPDDLEIMTLMAMNDYVDYLSGSGELTPADVQLMKNHPDVLRTLDGFREFLHKYIKRARKAKAGDGESE